MDFEFIQKLKSPKRTFILMTYNKDMDDAAKMPFVQITCDTNESYFIVTHLLEKYLPMRWQGFFEKSLQLESNDSVQYHCFLIKTNSWGQH